MNLPDFYNGSEYTEASDHELPDRTQDTADEDHIIIEPLQPFTLLDGGFHVQSFRDSGLS